MVITISRQFGTGGIEIGKKLAEMLGYDYYDKEIIEMASEKSGISEEMFERAEKEHNSFLYSLATANYAGYTTSIFNADISNSDNLFVIQSNVIREVAKKGNCVIVGRCGNQVLAEEPHVLKVYLHADKEYRINRVMSNLNIGRKEAETLVKKTDKKRASYYNFFTSGTWGSASEYDVCLNASVVGLDGTADVIRVLAEKLVK
ncbi:MAG: cytidylate kinase-like family protein [Clostridia bacterium]|nr:cytidylate kinase-like family protein [Clostridia bacterium]